MKRVIILPVLLILLLTPLSLAEASLTIPSDLSLHYGETALLSVTPETFHTCRWQTRITPDKAWAYTSLPGWNTGTLHFPVYADYEGRQYRCEITSPTGSRFYTNAATVHVLLPEITAQPQDVTTGSKARVDLTVTVTGDGLTYQWQTKLSQDQAWVNTGIDGSQTDTLHITTNLNYDGRQYRCVIRDSYGAQVISDAATLTVRELKIVTQPQPLTTGVGKTVPLTVTAEGDGLSYQWQTRLTPAGAWTNTGIPGNKTDTLLITPNKDYDQRQYRCVITDSHGGKVTSSAATLTVRVISLTAQPVSVTARPGETAAFAVQAEGEDLAYRWQTKLTEKSNWSNTSLNGCRTAELRFVVNGGMQGRQYRCVVSDAYGTHAVSEAATLTVPTPYISRQPADVTAWARDTVSLTVQAEGEGLSWQWQTRITPTQAWVNTGIEGNQTATLRITPNPDYDQRQYRCVVWDRYGNETISDAALLTVRVPVITRQPESVTAIEMTQTPLTVAAEGEGLSWQWQTRLTPDAKWVNTGIAGNQTDTLCITPSLAYDQRQYRCVIQDRFGNQAVSEAAVLTVQPKPADEPEEAPARPAGVYAVLSGADLMVTWDRVEQATAYRLYASTAATWQAESLTLTVDATQEASQQALLTGLPLQVDETWHVWVAAVNGQTEGEPSADAEVRVTLEPPTGVSASADATDTVLVTWQAAAGATGYQLFWGEKGMVSGNWPSVETAGTQAQVSGLEPGTQYRFFVKSMNGSQDSSFADFVTATTKPGLPAPKNVTFTVSDGSALITWDAVADATGYIVYVSTALDLNRANATTFPVSAAEGTAASLSGLPGQWYIWVAAVDENGPGKCSARRAVNFSEP